MKEVLAEISANILIVFSWCCGQKECEYMTQFTLWFSSWITSIAQVIGLNWTWTSKSLAWWSCENRQAKDRAGEGWWASESHPPQGSAEEQQNMTAGSLVLSLDEKPIRWSLKNLNFSTEYPGRFRTPRRWIFHRCPLTSHRFPFPFWKATRLLSLHWRGREGKTKSLTRLTPYVNLLLSSFLKWTLKLGHITIPCGHTDMLIHDILSYSSLMVKLYLDLYVFKVKEMCLVLQAEFSGTSKRQWW